MIKEEHSLTLSALGDLLHLERRAFAAASVMELGFTVVNETNVLAAYRQAALFRTSPSGTLVLTHASGLVSASPDTPYAVWLTQLVQGIAPEPAVQQLGIGHAPRHLADGWEEWLPAHVLACHIHGEGGLRVGLAIYAREDRWRSDEATVFERIHETYGYCLQALERKSGLRAAIRSAFGRGPWGKAALAALALAMLIPVRLSAIAPAEVVALSSVAVAAPQDGVVGTFHVRPNAPVKAGDKLFSLDDRGLESRRAVAQRALQTARADLLLAQQRSFDEARGRADLAAAQGRVKEKEAELALADGLLERVTVRAATDGIAMFSDPDDWVGRPVQTGERIMQLADPRDAGVLVWLPASDAINLAPGAPIRLFLDTQPLSPLHATLADAGYQPVPSPTGVASYRVHGRFDARTAPPRIGLRGTARVSGEWSLLGYYLLRRPIAAVRAWTGL